MYMYVYIYIYIYTQLGQAIASRGGAHAEAPVDEPFRASENNEQLIASNLRNEQRRKRKRPPPRAHLRRAARARASHNPNAAWPPARLHSCWFVSYVALFYMLVWSCCFV